MQVAYDGLDKRLILVGAPPVGALLLNQWAILGRPEGGAALR